jgi:uncharacterized protein YdeI (BOF family)
MKRLLGSLFVIAGVFSVGLGSALASPLPEPDSVMMLAESEEYERQNILIIASPDILLHPFFSSLFSSYANTRDEILHTSTIGDSHPHKNSHPAKSTLGTNGTNTQPGGTDGISATAPKSADGSPGGIASIPPIPNGTSGGKTTVSATLAPIGPTTVELTEVYPNTAGDDKLEEYLALKNTGDADVNLSGWTLKDDSEKTYVFPAGFTLTQGQILRIPRAQSNLSLNNDADKLFLFAPDQKLIDSLFYENAKQGDRYLRVGSVWKWSSDVQIPQPTSVPTIPVEPSESTNPQPVTTKANNTTSPKPANKATTSAPSASQVVSTPAPSVLTIAQAKEKSDDTMIKITAVANVSPGTLGKQFFYVQDETGGIQVYKHNTDFPDIRAGTKVIVEGVMSSSGQERRVKIPKTGSINVDGSVSEFSTAAKKIEELTTEKIGTLAKVSGALKNAAIDLIQIEEDGKTLEIGIASDTGIDTLPLTLGAKLEVTGILRPSGDGFKLMPRSSQDIRVLQEDAPATAATVDSGKTTHQKRDGQIATLIAATSGTILAIWIARQFIRHKKNLYVDPPVIVTAETMR